MKKRKLKKNVLIPIVVIIVLLVIILIKLFAFSSPTGKYGNRLDDIKKIKVTEKDKKAIISKLNENEKVTSVSVDIEGKIINIIMVVNDDTSKDDAKNIAPSLLEAINEDKKEKYDIQIFINKKNKLSENNDFPIIGYKNSKNNSFVW